MKLFRSNKGYTMVFVALMMPVIVAIMGFSIDGGLLLYYKAKLTTATKFAAISATSDYTVVGGQLQINEADNFARSALEANLNDISLVDFDFKVTPSKKNECTLKASIEVPFVFMKILKINSTIITESYTAERNL